MAYDKLRAGPDSAAHDAAAAADSILESLLDGLDVNDLFTALSSGREFVAYCFESGISKGESLSRIAQVVQLLERDNQLLSNNLSEPWGVKV